jgi:CDP-diacylglycerol--glycerol-3-phosphate 3-phosphatidyltransferase
MADHFSQMKENPMLTFPNFLSLLRLPLALLFFQENPTIRAIAIALAMASDGLDGYYARKYQQASRFGTLLDPLMDKLFVFIALAVFIHEQRLTTIEASAMICRDFSVVLFGLYLAVTGRLNSYQCRAIICGKITTALQFSLFLALTFNLAIPPAFYFIFVLLGILALVELYLKRLQTASLAEKEL